MRTTKSPLLWSLVIYEVLTNLDAKDRISFMKRRKHSSKNPMMRRVTIEFSRETKYQGVVLVDKLL
jgi:hypothetical protein